MCRELYDGILTPTPTTGHVLKSRAMSPPRRIPLLWAIVIVMLVTCLLALAPSARQPAQARSIEPDPSTGITRAVAGMTTGSSSIEGSPAEASAFSVQQQRNNGPDVLLMVLLTLGAAAGAAFLGLIGYVIRKRVGYWPHRPQMQEDAAAEERH